MSGAVHRLGLPKELLGSSWVTLGWANRVVVSLNIAKSNNTYQILKILNPYWKLGYCVVPGLSWATLEWANRVGIL